ncbi:MAG: hypothetical protein O2973_10710 [Gemmatimonadetes bacterium]|nr:hypothetical protein [Gemmatimonadota bacterium]
MHTPNRTLQTQNNHVISASSPNRVGMAMCIVAGVRDVHTDHPNASRVASSARSIREKRLTVVSLLVIRVDSCGS